jgi:hypothetical protein
MFEAIDSYDMEAQPQITTPVEEKHSNCWTGFIVWPLVILVLYALSWGPVMKMYLKGSISADNDFVYEFYAPLVWATANTPLKKPLRMYLHLWLPQGVNKNGDYRPPK